MIFLKSMSAETFEEFKQDSLTSYSENLALVEDVPFEVALKSASEKAGAVRIRLHVFHRNEIAKRLYLSMGFIPTNLDMRKDL